MHGPEGKYAWSVKVGEKGQIVIPKEARDLFGFKPGDTLVVLGDKNLGIAIPPKEMILEIADNLFSGEKNKEETK